MEEVGAGNGLDRSGIGTNAVSVPLYSSEEPRSADRTSPIVPLADPLDMDSASGKRTGKAPARHKTHDT